MLQLALAALLAGSLIAGSPGDDKDKDKAKAKAQPPIESMIERIDAGRLQGDLARVGFENQGHRRVRLRCPHVETNAARERPCAQERQRRQVHLAGRVEKYFAHDLPLRSEFHGFRPAGVRRGTSE